LAIELGQRNLRVVNTTMKKTMTLALLGSLVACAGATPAPNNAVASSVAAPNVSFAAYHTFTFGLADPPRQGYEVTERSLEVQRRLRIIVKTALEVRGLREAAEKPDLVVRLATGSGWGSPRPSRDSALVPSERGPAPAVGFIGIDIYEGASGGQVWQGSAFAEIDPMKIDDALLQQGVDHMLQSFGSPRVESMARAP
jgi:hypothetical protein